MVKIVAPLYVMLPRKTKADKKVYLNLNVYRNLHYISSNQAKHIFCEQMKDQLDGLKFDNPLLINFILFKASKRRVDRSNILSIVEKYFCDAMVYYKNISDDNDNFIQTTTYSTGGIDRDNPRCEIEIFEII